MATLQKIEICHFRGIQYFSQLFSKGLTCIVGRGDSGKTTVLEAISLVLSPNYSINFYDSDFYQCDVNTPIQIIATVVDLPEQLVSKYGEYVIGVKDGCIIEDLESEDAENASTALAIQLTVDKNLEPLWEVCSNRGQQPRAISAFDRSKLNMAYISDYSDRQLSMMKGNPLYSIYKQLIDEEEDDNTLIDTIRSNKADIDQKIEEKFQPIIEEIRDCSEKFGIKVDDLKVAIDQKDIFVKENKVCLHERNIPLRLKGKGSKRLVSLAVQLSHTNPHSIILIDEIEVGLEPDRVQHLVHLLKEFTEAQILFTTHSRDVLVELGSDGLYVMRKSNDKLLSVNSSMQGCVRRSPESFFAERIVVCEGATEVGFCRALNVWRIKNGKSNCSYLGIRLVDGEGDNMISRATTLKSLGFDVCLFCDSDKKEVNGKKQELIDSQIKIIDCDDGLAFETQVFNDVPWSAISSLIECRKGDAISDRNVFDSIQKNLNNSMDYCEGWLKKENKDIRQALAITAGEKEWFKRTTQGMMVGDIILSVYDSLEKDCRLKQNIDDLNSWFDKV